MRRIVAGAVAALVLGGLAFSLSALGPDPERNTRDDISADEEVIFFPTSATLSEDGTTWTVPIHGWIFEPERDSGWRDELLDAFGEILGDADDDSVEGRRFAERARMFLVDNERGERVRVEIAGRSLDVGPSSPNGHLRGSLRIPVADVERHASGGALRYRASHGEGDERREFEGRVILPRAGGVGVISDIDDTVKVSEILDREKMLERALFLPFEGVPGMAEVYRGWGAKGASIHWVSSSPWQLYPDIAKLLDADEFPQGAFHLRLVRWKDRSGWDFIHESSLESKPPIIQGILDRHADRRFVLVGDSGEHDPEVYGKIARTNPGRVIHIFVRRVEGADNSAERFAKAFHDLAPELWTVFEDPGVLGALELPQPVAPAGAAGAAEGSDPRG